MPTVDAIRHTALSESSPRRGTIDTLQYHHAAMTSLAGLERLMEPGGRVVSANYALATDGTLIEKVPVNRRALTSATVFDNRCLTVETVNTTAGPQWGISDASHRRMGLLAADMMREGLLTGLYYGPGGIIGHRDVPGTYATACPGPSYNADLILQYAREQLQPKPKPFDPLEGTMTAAYIFAPAGAGQPTRFALIGLDVPGGSFVTTSIPEAQAIGFAYGVRPDSDGVGAKNGGPVKQVSQAQLDSAVALYARLRAALVAEMPAGSGGSNAAVLQAISAATTAINANVDQIPLGFNITAK